MITKIETNLKDNKFFSTSSELSFTGKLHKEEFELLILYPEITYQTLLGFGGAFTEASAYALAQLETSMQEQILNDYFSPNGICYNFGRLHINSCDFSLENYAYLDKPNLSDFTIEHDKKYLIPMIKNALSINPSIQFLASPWSPPAFMKDNNNMNNGGKLLNTYKQLWADYLVNYVRSYKEEGIEISYMTIQNEPNAVQEWESCNYTAKEEADLLKNFLFPTFRFYNIPMKFLIWDQNKERILYRINAIYKDKEMAQFIAGIAYHYYTGDHFNNLAITKQLCPELLLIHSEGCTGYSKNNKQTEIRNAEIYAHDIIGDLNNGCNAYIDWNMVLEYYGGPNHKKNFCNAPIMTNKRKTGYTRMLTFYYIGHFSKYIKPGAKRIAYSSYTDKIEMTAFLNSDGSIVVVLLNRTDDLLHYKLNIQEDILEDSIERHSIVTYIIERK